MQLKDLRGKIPSEVEGILSSEGITDLRPAQSKAVNAGLLKGESLLVCTPTASGKTLTAELAATRTIIEEGRKAIYIAPLVALASEKHKEFKRKYDRLFKVGLSVGNLDSVDTGLGRFDLILCTAEKLDSLLRHQTPWIKSVKCVIIDEIHTLNDVSRGPTLEILITILRSLLPDIQILGLSATIGNPQELADWLNAKLVLDNWRPVQLKKAIYHQGQIDFDQ